MDLHQVEYLLIKANEFRSRDLWLHAAQLYYRVLANYPDRKPVYFDLAQMYNNMGYPRAAEQILIQGLKHFPEDPDLLYAIGISTYRSGQYSASERYFERLLPTKHPEVHAYLGCIAERSDRVQKAAWHFEEASKISSDYRPARYLLIETLVQLQSYERALELASASIDAGEAEWQIYSFAAVASVHLGNPDTAAEYIRTALNNEPDDYTTLMLAAEEIVASPSYPLAQPILEYLVKLNPQSVQALVLLGNISNKALKREQAYEYYSKALVLDPGNTVALERLQMLRNTQRKTV